MRLSGFLFAWCKDCLALMSGIVSVGLLFWATVWVPSESQSKYVPFVVSAICFVFESYRIRTKEYQGVCDLIEKTPIGGIEDLIPEFQKLVKCYASDEKTNPHRKGRPNPSTDFRSDWRRGSNAA
jgi:hypothetical protein